MSKEFVEEIRRAVSALAINDRPMASVMSKQLEILNTVLNDGITSKDLVYSVDSLTCDLGVAMRHDSNKNDPLRRVVYGMSGILGAMVCGLIEKNKAAIQRPAMTHGLAQDQVGSNPQELDVPINNGIVDSRYVLEPLPRPEDDYMLHVVKDEQMDPLINAIGETSELMLSMQQAGSSSQDPLDDSMANVIAKSKDDLNRTPILTNLLQKPVVQPVQHSHSMQLRQKAQPRLSSSQVQPIHSMQLRRQMQPMPSTSQLQAHPAQDLQFQEQEQVEPLLFMPLKQEVKDEVADSSTKSEEQASDDDEIGTTSRPKRRCKRVSYDGQESDNKTTDAFSAKKNYNHAKPHVCSVCSRGFRSQGELVNHMGMHTGKKAFPCPLCDISCLRSDHLKDHMRHKHGIQPFDCVTCAKRFDKYYELKKHWANTGHTTESNREHLKRWMADNKIDES